MEVEYKLLYRYDLSKIDTNLEKALNKLGTVGWELITIDFSDDSLYYFSRKLVKIKADAAFQNL